MPAIGTYIPIGDKYNKKQIIYCSILEGGNCYEIKNT